MFPDELFQLFIQAAADHLGAGGKVEGACPLHSEHSEHPALQTALVILQRQVENCPLMNLVSPQVLPGANMVGDLRHQEGLADFGRSGKSAVIENLLYTGAYILAGAPKIGKSFLVAQIAHHVSTGQDLWGYKVHQGTVLYLALEDDESRLQRRMFRMFGVEGTSSLHFATSAKMIGGGLDEQLEKFVREHSDTKLIIVDTLQKVREAVSDSYSYSSDYEVIGKLKQFADRYGVCVLIVHHTRKQPAGDSFEMISGTTGLLGCADGALLMQKEKRTDSKATLEVVGRDQPDQRLYLSKDQENLVWGLDHAENELWKQPTDPVLEAVAKIVSVDNREWEGSPTELAQAIQTDMAVNRLTKHLNVNASRLLEKHQVKYENKTKHAGRRIRLTYIVVEAPAFEVIE